MGPDSYSPAGATRSPIRRERLPPAKDLAAVLGINTNTVLRSLRVLRDGGLLRRNEMTDTRERLRRFLIRTMSRAHEAVYRASGGRLLGRVAGMPVLLLTTTGRRSGRPQTATLTYFRDGDDLVVIGSFGGSDSPPAWWLNLQRDPRASVLIGVTTSTVAARAATTEEHDRLWPLVTETNPGYARYQKRTARPIPIVLLTPVKELSR